MLSQQVGSVMQMVEDSNPDSYFGFATFGDKNISGIARKTQKKIPHLGYETDYCLHVDVGLGKPSAKHMVKLFDEYRSKAAGGGGDWSENVYGALYRAALAPKLGWRQQTKKGRRVARLAVVVTDAMSHSTGDVFNLTGKTVLPFGKQHVRLLY